jgi:deoxycytidylate deaminase
MSETQKTANEKEASTTVPPAAKRPIELVFGLVGPTGVDLPAIAAVLESQLKALNYDARQISLSALILGCYGGDAENFSAYDRTDYLIKKGNSLCRDAKERDIIGRLGLQAIQKEREKISGCKDMPHISARVAYIVRSFKRQEEVELYRDIYGKAFTLISVYASKSSRIQALSREFQSCIPMTENNNPNEARTPEELAIRIIDRDYKEEEEDFGQRVGKTFPLADFFLSDGPRLEIERQLARLVRLTLGDPYISPTRDEQGMFFAYAAALRSLDLSRQVGAAVVTQDGEILSTGCNEVPKFGGGLYWAEDSECHRDFELGYDANVKIKVDMVADAVRKLRDKKWLSDTTDKKSDERLAEEMLFGSDNFFASSKLFDVIEFGRAVHAEMDAISQAARMGIPLQNARLFCTTFPCHICARHIIAAGIKDVQFIEPYEKSQTSYLYSDSISIEPHDPAIKKANFKAFVGVAPRRYIDMFQMNAKRKGKDGSIIDRSAQELKPKFKQLVFAYISAETLLIKDLESLLKTKGKS